jgi:hypothetical protein
MKHLWVILESWIENYVLTLSILERLIMGMGLGFFGLVTLYVLLFRSSIARSLPRTLFRLALILILITTSILSYLTLTRSLIQQTDENQVSPTKGRADMIRHLEKEREREIEQTIGP